MTLNLNNIDVIIWLGNTYTYRSRYDKKIFENWQNIPDPTRCGSDQMRIHNPGQGKHSNPVLLDIRDKNGG